MKNRLIYILISLMLISLIGIISIQTVWIKGAISNREREFNTHVNDALNKLNDDIDRDEAKFIIDKSIGSSDSLLHEAIFIEEQITSNVDSSIEAHQENSRIVILDKPNHEKHRTSHRREINLSEVDSLENQLQDLQSELGDLEVDLSNWNENVQIKLKLVDSVLSSKDELIHLKEAKMDRVTSVVEHITFEKFLSGDLKNRISSNELNEKLHKALKKEGLDYNFEYAVFNDEKKQYEDGFVSSQFNKEDTNVFSKTLFPIDYLNTGNYRLQIQLSEKGGYIWKGVRNMAIMSAIFSLLILISFGYALYSIFKQKKISQVKNDFINNMTHELKTPLASISLASASIKHPKIIHDPKEIERFVDIIENEKKRMNSHIEKVLDIAALENGDLKLDQKEVNLNEIIQSSIKNIELALLEKNGNYSLDSRFQNALVFGDKFHLINVFTNILDNSIKYRDQDPIINIVLDVSQESYTVEIKDNGIGMNSKEMKLAFNKFYRAQSGNIHNRKGFGLGLSYVKSMINQHSGTVNLTSVKGKGTTVTLTIPKYNG